MSASAVFATVDIEQLDTRYGELRLPRPEAKAAVRRSVERHGMLNPLVVNRVEDDLVVLDGFKRLDALRELGQRQAAVRIVRLEESAAQAALLTYNAPHQGLCELEEGWVVRSLVRNCKLTQVTVGELVGRHKSWVCRRLQLAERLAAAVQDDMRLGLVNASAARELARLPRGNQGRVAEAVRKHELTSRQSAELVDRCLQAHDTPEGLDELLADPLRFLVAAPPQRPRSADPRLGTHGQEVRRWLVRLEGVANGVRHALRAHPPAQLSGAELTVLAEMAGSTAERTEAALELITRLLSAAGEPATAARA